MTVDQLIEIERENLKDELEDVKKYIAMSKAANELGDRYASNNYLAIANDEFTHAEFAKMHLSSLNVHIDELTLKNMSEVHHMLHNYSRRR